MTLFCREHWTNGYKYKVFDTTQNFKTATTTLSSNQITEWMHFILVLEKSQQSTCTNFCWALRHEFLNRISSICTYPFWMEPKQNETNSRISMIVYLIIFHKILSIKLSIHLRCVWCFQYVKFVPIYVLEPWVVLQKMYWNESNAMSRSMVFLARNHTFISFAPLQPSLLSAPQSSFWIRFFASGLSFGSFGNFKLRSQWAICFPSYSISSHMKKNEMHIIESLQFEVVSSTMSK